LEIEGNRELVLKLLYNHNNREDSKMKLCNRKTFRVLAMMVVLAFLVMSSAVFALEMKPLKGDKILPKYESIVFGRMRIISSIPKFNPLGEEFRFYLYDLHSKKSLEDFTAVIKGSTRIKGGAVKGYDVPFYGQAQGGDYLFGWLGYHFSMVSASEMGLSWDGYYSGIGGRIFKACSIPVGSLVYLGVIEVNFTKVTQADGSNIDTVTNVNLSMDDYDIDLAKFQKAYPKLYEQFKDNVVKADWENFKNTEDTADEEEE
jgi:hypothetical protein